MKLALSIVLLIVAGLIIGPFWSGNTGYVLIAFGQTSIELSLVAAVILLVLVSFILLKLGQGIAALVRGTSWGIKWFGRRRQSKAEQAQTSALEALLTQDYNAAHKAFARAWQLNKASTNALLAAYSAGQVSDHKAAKDWLAKGGQAEQLQLASVLLDLNAKAELSPGKMQQLKKLLEQYPHHPQLLRMAARSYIEHHQWRPLIEILPRLADYTTYTSSDVAELTERAYKEVMLQVGANRKDDLKNYWDGLSKDLRRQGPVRKAYIGALKRFGLNEVAGKVAARGLKRGELELGELIQGQLIAADQSLRDYLQDCLKRNADNALMLHALGQLALEVKDFTLAQRALKRAAELAPSAQVWLDLASAEQGAGNPTGALEAIRKSAMI